MSVEPDVRTQVFLDTLLHYVVVEGLEKSREPLPTMDAIYIISPTESVSVVYNIQNIRIVVDCQPFSKLFQKL